MIVNDMGPYRHWVDPLLREAQIQAEANKDWTKILYLRLALLPVDEEQADQLYQSLLEAKPEQFAVIRGALVPHKEKLLEPLCSELVDQTHDPDKRFRAACALAEYAPDDPRVTGQSVFVVKRLVREDALVLNFWKEALQPIGGSLLSSLAAVLQEEKADPLQRRMMAQLYIGFAGPEEAERMLSENIPRDSPAEVKVSTARRIATIAAALAAIGRGEKVWPLLVHSEDPTLRSYLIERLEPAGVDPRALERQLDLATDDSVRRALILALGSYDGGTLRSAQDKLLKLYENDPDPGIHGASGWVLRRWGQKKRLRQIDQNLATGKPEGKRNWYVNRQGQTMVLLSMPWLAASGKSGTSKPASKRAFAIASTEVTVDEIRRWKRDHEYVQETAPTGDCPANSMSWYQAAEYCNWLSKQEGIPESQWCYQPNASGKFEKGMRMAPDYLQARGLPFADRSRMGVRVQGGGRNQMVLR